MQIIKKNDSNILSCFIQCCYLVQNVRNSIPHLFQVFVLENCDIISRQTQLSPLCTQGQVLEKNKFKINLGSYHPLFTLRLLVLFHYDFHVIRLCNTDITRFVHVKTFDV